MMSNKPQFVGEKVRLGDICTIVSGATPKTKTDEYWGGIIKWITPAELSDDSHYVSDTEKHLTDAGFKNASLHMMPKGTVLLTTRSPIGKIAIATEEMCCNQGFKNLICSEAINNEFLFRYLKSQTTRLQAMGHGATFKELSKKDVAEFKINLPTLDRQLEAVDKLAAVEGQLAHARDQLNQLDSLVKSRFVEMFGARDFPRIRLDKVADVQGGLTKNSRRETLPMQLPYLRVANVGPTGGVDTSEMLSIGLTGVEARKTLLKADDLLFVEGNGSKDQIGRAAIWDGSIDPCVHQNHLIRARLHDNVLPIFALAFFSSSVGRRQITDKAASTSGLFTLSTGKIKSLELPVPPLSLQQKFAAFVAQVDKSRFAYIWSRTKSVEQALSGPSLTLVIQHIEPQTRSKYRADVLASPSWPSVDTMFVLKTPRVCVLISTG